MAKRRPTKKQSDRWFWIRYDALVADGFTPNEAFIISRTKISSSAVRRIRRQRKRMLQSVMNTGVDRRTATLIVREDIRRGPNEILDWEIFRRVVYPVYRERVSLIGFVDRATAAYEAVEEEKARLAKRDEESRQRVLGRIQRLKDGFQE